VGKGESVWRTKFQKGKKEEGKKKRRTRGKKERLLKVETNEAGV